MHYIDSWAERIFPMERLSRMGLYSLEIRRMRADVCTFEKVLDKMHKEQLFFLTSKSRTRSGV